MKIGFILCFLCVLTFSDVAAQSDDGWFTGKAAFGYKFCSADYIYNLENHFSFGTGFGALFYDGADCFFNTSLRIRPFGKQRVMPALWFSYGYMTKEKTPVFMPEFYFESGNLSPLRLAFGIGGAFFSGQKHIKAGVALEF
ncbi:MAG: hypothetical protein II956_09295 [Bacteroidales bacterium]|nr:hypothetical protein [Bacteroidales bacterium]